MMLGDSIYLKGSCQYISIPVCCLKVEMDKHIAVADCCTSADRLCLLLADKQGEVICDGLAHSERER